MGPSSPQGRVTAPGGSPDRRSPRSAGPAQVSVKGTLHSVERALRALELVADSGDGITAKAVARRLGCTLSTSYNVLNTLVAAGYLVRLPEARGYGLGYQVVSLTRVLWNQLAVNSDVRNALARLHAEADAPVYLAVYRDADVVVGHVVDSTSRPRVEPIEVGYSQGAHATAYGKVLLAALTPERRRAVLGRTGLPPFTRRTVVDLVRLHAELDAVARTGVAVEVEEFRDGVAGVAAPVRLCAEVVGALEVSVPVAVFDVARDRLEEAVRRHSADVAAAMSAAVAAPETWADKALAVFCAAGAVSGLTESWPLSHRCMPSTMNRTWCRVRGRGTTLTVAVDATGRRPWRPAGGRGCRREVVAHRSGDPAEHVAGAPPVGAAADGEGSACGPGMPGMSASGRLSLEWSVRGAASSRGRADRALPGVELPDLEGGHRWTWA